MLSSPSTSSTTTDDTDDVTMISSSRGKGNGKTTSTPNYSSTTTEDTSENINNVTSPPKLTRYDFKASHGWYARCVVKRLSHIYVKSLGRQIVLIKRQLKSLYPLI